MTTSPASSNITGTNISADDSGYFYCTEMPAGSITWAAFSVLCACVGFPASVWLLWVLVQRQRSGMTNDTYMLNLTIKDLIFNAFSIPGMLNYMVWRNDLFSLIDNILYALNMTGRPLMMTCMCVDCFMAVVYPITYMKMKHSRYRLLACAAVWCFTLCTGTISIFVDLMFLSFRAALYLLTIPTIVVCDLAMLYSLRKPDPSGKSDVHPQKQRAMQTITTSLVMTLVCYLPTLMLPFLNFIPMNEQVKRCSVSNILYIAPLLGSAILPLLQLHSLGKLMGLQPSSCVSGSSEQPDQQP